MGTPYPTLMMLRDLVQQGMSVLSPHSGTARLDAEVLLGHVLGVDRLGLVTRMTEALSPGQVQCFQQLLTRRCSGEPIAYILGYKEFYGLSFKVSPAVLIPRPETEVLVDRALAIAESIPAEARFLDLGTGSGCIAAALVHELQRKKVPVVVTAVDVSQDALAIARANCCNLGVEGSIQFIQSDWFSGLSGSCQRFHIILSNPPYVDRNLPDLDPGLRFEPEVALFAERQGLAAIEKLVRGCGEFLAAGGAFLCEVGSEQRPAIERFLDGFSDPQRWFDAVSFHTDLAGHSRVMELKRKG